MKVARILVALILVGVSGQAFSESLAEKKKAKEAQEDFEKKIATANTDCGSKMKATMDTAALKKSNDGARHCSGACAEPVGGSCAYDKDLKAEIAKRIKELKCTYAKSEKTTYTVKGSTIICNVSDHPTNDSSAAKDALMNAL